VAWLTSKTTIVNKINWVARILVKTIILYSSWHIGEAHLHNSHSSLSCRLIMFNHLELLLERRREIILRCIRTLLHACWTELKCSLILRVETLSGHSLFHRFPALPFPSLGLRRIHWFKFRPCHIRAGGPESVNVCLQYDLVIENCLHSSRSQEGDFKSLRGSGCIQPFIQPVLC
jgi:hypothetical protein